MKITVIGGGPGGLYFSILIKKALPDCTIDVFERNRADDFFGFGVVFSDETLSEFLSQDPDSYELIRSRFAYWDELDVVRNGETVRITGNGFCGCSRKTLLQLLHQRCAEVGVGLHFEQVIDNLDSYRDSDVVVLSDGIGSAFRSQFQADFGTRVKLHSNRFVWLGSTRPLDSFAYFFRSTPQGTVVAHAYQYEEGRSTWIFETSDQTWQMLGFEIDNEQDTIRKLAEIFEEELAGHSLISNKSHWRQFPHVTNERWHKDNLVLLGDSKATAHFSIGSGTKLAMECAIALADSLAQNQHSVSQAFQQYEQKRRKRVAAIQTAATISSDWFEAMDRHMQHPFLQFAFGVMTRARKVTFENLRLRDPLFTGQVLAAFNRSNGISNLNTPAAFSPFLMGKMHLQNRMVMSSMGQYSAIDGLVNDWHLVHYGSRSVGGCGLLITEMTAITPSGRITEGCAGIWSEAQTQAWKQIVDFVHRNSRAKIGIQLGHAGRKGSVRRPWEGGYLPLETGWDLMAASPIAYNGSMPAPSEMTPAMIDQIVGAFETAAANADAAGFDCVEIQAHHGFLLATFISPLTNQRTDEFGGTLENRLRFPLRVLRAVRARLPLEKPVSVRISASDWAEGGISESEVLEMAKAFAAAGADILNVSTGGTVTHQKYSIKPMWQTTFAELVRNTVHVPVITTGAIDSIDQVNTLLLNGRADLVALGKPLLINPAFVRQAQAYEQFEAEQIENLDVPPQYLPGIQYLYPQAKTERQATEAMKKALKPRSHKS